MSIINIVNLSFGYEGSLNNIFENVSFNLDTTWKLGLIGRNGRGKTTLLKLLGQEYGFNGQIISKTEFAYFPYPIADESINTIDIVGDDWQIYRELSLLKVSEEVLFRPFNSLSAGEKTKVLLAAMFIKEDKFLLIDEPTNHLDAEGRRLLGDYLRHKQGFILVSHDRALLDNCVDHIMAINKADIEIVAGNFSSWHENRQRRDNFEQNLNLKLKKEITRLTTTAKEKAAWSDRVEKTKYHTKNSGLRPDRGYIGHQAAKMMQRSKSIEARINNQIKEKESLLKNIDRADSLKISPLAFHAKRLLQGRQIAIKYGQNMVLSGLDFEIFQGQKVNIKGQNGSGKSSLIKLILGEDINYDGDFFKAQGLIISYISQDTGYLKGNLTDFEAKEQLDISLFRSILSKLGLARNSFEQKLERYSAGQKKKLLIAKSLSQKAHIYIWDEPLNYIDILSRIQIENLLKTANITLLFVEHDQMFCDNIADKTINLS